MLLSFQLTMPNKGSWNGKWTGQLYFIVKDVSKRYMSKKEHFKQILEKGSDNFHYSFGDGWSANVKVEIVDAAEAKKRRKASVGFAGYDWMVAPIIYKGEITYSKS